MAKPRPPNLPAPDSQLRDIRERVRSVGFVCSGTVVHKTKSCGKRNCACASDPDSRHGPYYEWHRREGGRQVHTMLPEDVGPLFEQASENYRKLLLLLQEWEKESARAMLARSLVKARKTRDL